MIEDEMVGWYYQLNGHEFGWTLVVGDEQGGLVCCGSWGHKESDTTERLNCGRLKQCRFLFSQFWRLEVQDQGVGKCGFCCTFFFGWQMAPDLLCPHMAFLLCV